MTLTELYHQRRTTPSDINELLPTLHDLAEDCNSIAEFGVRDGNSTVAFLHGINDGGGVYSYDIKEPTARMEIQGVLDEDAWWIFTRADTTKVQIPDVDMLFVDAFHDYKSVRAELKPANLDRVRKYLAFHDTELFGWRDQRTDARRPGILPAILSALATDGNWRLHYYTRKSNGLTVFERVK